MSTETKISVEELAPALHDIFFDQWENDEIENSALIPTYEKLLPIARRMLAAEKLYEAAAAAFIALPMTKHNEPINEELKAALAAADGKESHAE